MLMRNLVVFLFTVFAFVLFASADDRPKTETRAEILSRISDYKTWKQVNRVDEKPAPGANTFTIENSSIGGG